MKKHEKIQNGKAVEISCVKKRNSIRRTVSTWTVAVTAPYNYKNSLT